MGKENNQVTGVRLSFETENYSSVWESPHYDVSFEDILEGFVGMCIAQGWQPSTVITNMADFAEDRKFWTVQED